jgi:subtilisin family serine protease
MRGRRFVKSVAAVVLVAALAAGTGAAMAQPSGSGASAEAPPMDVGARATYSVTLLTGDRVTVTTGDEGVGRMVTVTPGPDRSGVAFVERETEAGALHVIPVDAIGLLAAGRLDPRLFDITGLIEQGYDDAASPQVPLIVRYDDRPRARASARDELSSAGATVGPELPSIGGAVVKVPKSRAATRWEQLTSSIDHGADGFDVDIAQVHLDGRVRATLDESVVMIGATSAWESGYTGAGVRVAVLDSGIFGNHPDLNDAVIKAEDFTDSWDGVEDLFGHGTHVASIVAGRATASGGQYVGVAPDAELLIGKVLDDGGWGDESWVIAGMEWAVAQDAAVVNMSLGRDDTPGIDLLEEAVNSLSDEHGTLFVVAAGNEAANQTINSPASADAALAVGAVDKSDQLADFSSRGPRVGDSGLKPELTGPGVGIVAARSPDGYIGEPVDEHYVTLSGTSMSAPHVTGAAAILAQLHPDWSGDRLKAALVGSAAPNPELTAYEQGAGRVDVAAVLGQTVVTEPAALSFGIQPWPHDDDEPIELELVYHNTGDDPISMDLSYEISGPGGQPVDPGFFTLEPESVTIEPGATALVVARADTAVSGPDGRYSGAVVATAAEQVVRTPFGVDKEVESYDLTIEVIDRNGEPAWTEAYLGDLGAETLRDVFVPGEPVTMRLPAGTYDLNSFIFTDDQDDPEAGSVTLAARPELVLDRDLRVVLDAREASLVQATVDSSTARPGLRRAFLHTYRHHLGIGTDIDTFELYATATAPVTSYDYTFGYQSALAEPESERPANGRSLRGYQLFRTEDGRIPEPAFRFRDRELARLDTTIRNQGTVDEQVATLYAFPMPVDDGAAWGQFYDVRVPSRRVDLYSEDATVRWATELRMQDNQEDDYDLTLHEYKAGQRYEKTWNSAAIGPVARPTFAFGFLWANLSPFAPSAFGHYTYPGWDGIEASTTLTKDGVVVATNDEPDGGMFELPAESASYELTTTATRDVAWSTLATRVDATWKVTAGPSDGNRRLPLLGLRVSGDHDLQNGAPVNRPFRLELRVDRADGHEPAVHTIRLEASFDDGETWRHVRVRPGRDRFHALVPRPPAGSGFVSLRAYVEDADGSQLEQTVIRAYQLTAGS